ncbi:tRNA (guanosine(37)-N1)-methyltransferase TrmD [Corynebacterium choanae]|uniref:tRNA (guanine-N(1)-)-methyltransferase n=1 Tax=Corynebacterium choanae TaxID=1862358 RepID=A0A3G6JAE1_9CORY|nr:tRNA (guanosine(37)-N1)-methyltransferase TrmD [Corynebacterium choanae]AZA13878.1 tRNA (guanine-N(1)-)-methyltransferase [Corynebacterium choanae]
MRVDVISIFPDYLSPLGQALIGKAIERGQVSVTVHNLRDWTDDVHQAVDDSPYGGGPGMVMKPSVWGPALVDVASTSGLAQRATPLGSATPHRNVARHDDLRDSTFTGYEQGDRIDPARGETPADADKPLLIVPTPAGRPFTQSDAQAWSGEDHVVFAPGRYEGIDQRVITAARKHYRVREVSIGDYVLIGGEVAVLVIAEAIIRLIPGVLGNASSHAEDSFSDGLLEGPSYTKPALWEGLAVPEVLLSGNHGKIARWRREQSLQRTATIRPDLLTAAAKRGDLTAEDLAFLASIEQSDGDVHNPSDDR